jgi:hypothetical protein
VTEVLRNARRIVVKVGSSLVTNEGRGVDAEAIANWCLQLAALARQGRELIMVSSGAIAEGMKRLGWTTRPRGLHDLQAAAAVGQMGLVQMYESKLSEQGLRSAQVLLTHADLTDRERYLNARSTLLTARIAGRAALAVARAEGALAWAPRSTDGWDLLASYLALELASAEREPDVARRRAWLEAGIGVTERGEELADDPARLALLRGVLYTSKAEEDPELDPGGAPALWERAARAYERAAALGFAGADAFALAARQRAAD